jgi:hypothetical protein
VALQLLTTIPGTAPQRIPLGPGRTRVSARPGAQYQLIDDAGQVPPGASIKRFENAIVVEGLPDGRSVEISDFFTACGPDGATTCQISTAELGGGSGPITPSSDPIGALPDGSFLLYGSTSTGGQIVAPPLIAGTENLWRNVGLGAGGLALAGLAVGAGGGGGGGGSTADTTAPPPPTLTGRSVQNSGTPTFTGTGEAGSLVLVRIDLNGNGVAGDGADPTFQTTVGADGTWTLNLAGATPVTGAWSGSLPDAANYVVSAVSRDAAGNVSATTSGTLTIDTRAPAAPVVDAIAGDGVVSGAEAGAGVTVSGTGEAGASVRISWGSTSKTGTVGADGRWSLLFGSAEIPATQGATSVQVSLTDAAGNVSPATQRSVVIDTVGPGAPTVTSGAVTADPRPVITGTSEPSARVRLSLDLASNGSVDAVFDTIANAQGSWSVNTASAPTSGSIGAGLVNLQPNSLTVVATDVAGNLGAGTDASIVRDIAGTPATLSIALASDTGSSASDGVTRTGLVNVSGVVAGYTWQYSVDGGASWRPGTGSSFSIAADGIYQAQARQRNLSGVDSSPSPALNITIDNVSPSGPVVTDNVTGPTANGPVTFTFAFAEPVAGFTAADVNVTGGTVGAFTATSSAVYTLVVTPTPDVAGTISVSVPAGPGVTDLAGNALASAGSGSQAFNTVIQPTLTITDDAGGTAAGPVLFTFTFSEPVTQFTAADIVTSGGATVGTFTALSQAVYTAVITPPAGTGTFTVDVPASAAVDLAGNPSLAAAQVSQPYAPADATLPTVVITDNVPGVVNNTTTDVVFTFTFSEPVTGFSFADLQLSGGGSGTFSPSVTAISPTVYTFGYTAAANTAGTVGVTVVAGAATDGSGNLSVGPVSTTQAFDRQNPTVSVADNFVGATATGPVTFTFTTSEAVNGLTFADLTIFGGTASAGDFTPVNATTYSVLVTPLADQLSTMTVSVGLNSFTDLAGNLNAAGSSGTQSFDTRVAPTLTSITDNTPGIANSTSGPITYTFNWSEPVTGFDFSDITRTGAGTGTFGTLTGSGASYTLTYTPAANSTGTLVLSVPSGGGITDVNGNAYAGGATSNSQAYDTQPPTQSGNATANLAGATPQIIVGLDAVLGSDSVSLVRTGGAGGTVTLAAPTVTGGGTTLTFTEASALASATYTYTATITDTAGNSIQLDLDSLAAGRNPLIVTI